MAKAAKSTNTAAKSQAPAKASVPVSPEPNAEPNQDPQAETKKSKQMSKADAQAVVDRYAGINNVESALPKELQEARKVLKGK